jgi:hypothetical protein
MDVRGLFPRYSRTDATIRHLPGRNEWRSRRHEPPLRAHRPGGERCSRRAPAAAAFPPTPAPCDRLHGGQITPRNERSRRARHAAPENARQGAPGLTLCVDFLIPGNHSAGLVHRPPQLKARGGHTRRGPCKSACTQDAPAARPLHERRIPCAHRQQGPRRSAAPCRGQPPPLGDRPHVFPARALRRAPDPPVLRRQQAPRAAQGPARRSQGGVPPSAPGEGDTRRPDEERVSRRGRRSGQRPGRQPRKIRNPEKPR